MTPDEVELEHVGLNHLSWERAVRVDGVDRLPELVETDADELGEMVGVPGVVVRTLRALPSYYLRYYYSTDVGAARSSSTATRARRRSWTSSATCSSCTATRPSTRSRSCSSTAAAPSTARRPRS